MLLIDQLGRQILPAQKDENQDAQFDGQISGSEHEGHGDDEVGTFLDQCPGRGQCGYGARGRRNTESVCQRDALCVGRPHVAGESLLGNEGLDHGADGVAENKGSAGFPEKANRRFGGVTV